MDIDAEFNRLRAFIARAEPVLSAYEASRGDGMGTPSGFTAEQWAELSRIEDRLGAMDHRLAPWEQGEHSIPLPVQDLAQRIIARIDRLEEALGKVDRFAAELARLSGLTADLAEIIENRDPGNKTAAGPAGEAPGDGDKDPAAA